MLQKQKSNIEKDTRFVFTEVGRGRKNWKKVVKRHQRPVKRNKH